MKKISLLFTILFFPSFAQAELLKFQAGFSFMKCEKVEADVICGRQERPLRHLEIDLITDTENGGLWGETRFTTSEDGVEFEGTVEVQKIEVNGQTRFILEVYVASMPQNNPELLAFDFIGMTTANESFANFNDSIFTGRRVKTDAVDLTPFLSVEFPRGQ